MVLVLSWFLLVVLMLLLLRLLLLLFLRLLQLQLQFPLLLLPLREMNVYVPLLVQKARGNNGGLAGSGDCDCHVSYMLLQLVAVKEQVRIPRRSDC